MSASSIDEGLSLSGLLVNPRDTFKQTSDLRKFGESIRILAQQISDLDLHQRLENIGNALKNVKSFKEFEFKSFMISGNHRVQDAETKILENLRLDLLLKLAQGSITGDTPLSFLLYTTRVACPSCQAVAVQFVKWFHENFPGLSINIKIAYDQDEPNWNIKKDNNAQWPAAMGALGLPTNTNVFNNQQSLTTWIQTNWPSVMMVQYLR